MKKSSKRKSRCSSAPADPDRLAGPDISTAFRPRKPDRGPATLEELHDKGRFRES
jgi:hypothetical protein